MLIKQAHAPQSSISLPASAAKPPAKAGEPVSFSALLGKLTPAPAPQPNYRPVGTIHVGTQPITTTTTTTTTAPTTSSPTSSPAPFSPVFVQGATVTAPDGSTNSLNPDELATAPTAQQVAALLGGSVVQDNMSNFTQSSPTLEISVPGSNVEVNAGLAAKLFAQYGTDQGSQAWQIINRDLGRTS